MKLRVIMGRDVDLSAELHFPFKLLSSLAKRQSTKFAQKIETVKSAMSWADSWIHYASNTVSKVTKVVVPIFKPSKQVYTLTTKQIKMFRPERRQCLDSKLNDIDMNDRLLDLSYENTAIFYEKGKEVFAAGPEKNTLYLQLRTKGEEVVCGLPLKNKDLQVILVRDEKQQGFINLVNLFSYKRPVQDAPEEFESETVFDHSTNLFVVKVSLPHSGRYKIQLKFGNYAEFIPNALVYVKNDY